MCGMVCVCVCVCVCVLCVCVVCVCVCVCVRVCVVCCVCVLCVCVCVCVCVCSRQGREQGVRQQISSSSIDGCVSDWLQYFQRPKMQVYAAFLADGKHPSSSLKKQHTHTIQNCQNASHTQ